MEQGTAHHPNLHLPAFWLTALPWGGGGCSFLQKQETHQTDKVFSPHALVIYSLLTMATALHPGCLIAWSKGAAGKKQGELIDTYK